MPASLPPLPNPSSPSAPLGGWLRTPLASGAAEAAAVAAAILAVGLGSAWLAGRAGAGPAFYLEPAVIEPVGAPPRDAPPALPAARVWLVDGFNVLQVGLLESYERSRTAWWAGPSRARLLGRAAGFADRSAAVWVVFDGPDAREAPVGDRLYAVFAPSADDWLLRRVRSAPAPGELAVVTADRRLAARARHVGAQVVPPHAFLAHCTLEGELLGSGI